MQRYFFSEIKIEEQEDKVQWIHEENFKIEELLKIPEIVDLDWRSYFLGNLLVCPTPLGNLKDLSIRTFEALTEADIIVCEDTRVTGKLFKMLRVKNFDQDVKDYVDEEENSYEKDERVFDYVS